MRGLKLGCTWRMHLKKLPDRQMTTLKIIYLDVTSRFSISLTKNFVKELALCDWSIYPIALAYAKKNSIIKLKE